MAEHFDPYHKWLGIPLKDQPPNHYRLLGVDRFESDREVIDAAANRLMAYLHDLSTGDQAAAAQRLLNQIAAARLVLLTPAKKAAYDKQLRAESAPMAKPLAPQSPPVAKPVASQQAPPAKQQQTPPPTTAPGPGPMAPTVNPPSSPSDGPIIVTDEQPGRRQTSPSGGNSGTYKPRKQPSLVPIIVLAIVALVIAAVATYVVIQPPTLSPQNNSSANKKQTPPKAETRLRLLIPEKDRAGILVSIGGRKQKVPDSGEISFLVKAGTASLMIKRAGFATISRDIEFAEGVTTVYEPKFKVEAGDATKYDIPDEALQDLSNAEAKGDESKPDED